MQQESARGTKRWYRIRSKCRVNDLFRFFRFVFFFLYSQILSAKNRKSIIQWTYLFILSILIAITWLAVWHQMTRTFWASAAMSFTGSSTIFIINQQFGHIEYLGLDFWCYLHQGISLFTWILCKWFFFIRCHKKKHKRLHLAQCNGF